MVVRRRRRRKPRDDHSTRITTLGALGMSGAAGGDLGAAADIIADKARELASGWSHQVPGSIRVEVSGDTATISSSVGPAYPNEVAGVRHPTFGHSPWKTNQHRPFLSPAADAAGDKAMTRYAQKIDRWAKQAGFS